MTIAQTEREEIIAMRKRGMSVESIAQQMKHDRSTIRKICAADKNDTINGARPHIYLGDVGRYVCEGRGSSATGKTAKQAFTRWGVAREQAEAAVARRDAAKAVKEAQAKAQREEKAAAKGRITPPRSAVPWRDLVIPVFVKRQQARAAAVQPPMQSMASTVHGVWVE